MSLPSMVRPLLILGAGLLLMVVGTGAWMLTGPARDSAGVSGQTRGSGTALIGGPYELVDHKGRTRTEADFKGRYQLIYFGYTFCPDFCPSTLNVMSQALDKLAESSPETADRVVPLFITIDPERDTVEAMDAYVAHFHGNFVGLTGNDEQIAAAAKAYRVFYRKVGDGGDDEDYLVDHSTFTYLMDAEGNYAAHFAHNTTPEAMAEEMEALIDG